ncbi:MAG: GntR family transcriptional regulator [Leucobacter sp.]
MNRFTPKIDPAASLPPFRQLHEAVVSAIAAGELVPGAKLPTVRALAQELSLATNTVASAYRTLEAAGVVEGRGRAGTFVQLGNDPIEAQAREIMLETAQSLSALGVSRERAVQLLSDAFDARQS